MQRGDEHDIVVGRELIVKAVLQRQVGGIGIRFETCVAELDPDFRKAVHCAYQELPIAVIDQDKDARAPETRVSGEQG
jgi:hypothetical protein